jgi:hypothetical protein
VLVVEDALLQFGCGSFSLGYQISVELRSVADRFVVAEDVAVYVEIADCACSLANLADRSPQLLRPLRRLRQIGGCGEEFEDSFDAAGGGAKVVNGLWLRIVQTFGHCGLEVQSVAKKRDDRLRHRYQILTGASS